MGNNSMLICRNCDADLEAQDSDDTTACLKCGLGVVNPADRPAGVQVKTEFLPVILAGGDFTCSCGYTFQPKTYHTVDAKGRPMCRTCAPLSGLAVWQLFCDAADALDEMMQTAAGQRERSLLAQMVAQTAEHFARWRWPQDDAAPVHASELSCQGLAAVQVGSSGVTFHGKPVDGYLGEMRRRGEDHVYGCDQVGHGIADD